VPRDLRQNPPVSVVAFSRVAFPDQALGEAFAAALAGRSHLVDRFPGFQRLEVLLPAKRGGDWVLATWWDTRDDLRRWLRSDEHRLTHLRAPAELDPYLRSARVEIFEVQT
jgi:heme-degrading monooxygenase HmoA